MFGGGRGMDAFVISVGCLLSFEERCRVCLCACGTGT